MKLGLKAHQPHVSRNLAKHRLTYLGYPLILPLPTWKTLQEFNRALRPEGEGTVDSSEKAIFVDLDVITAETLEPQCNNEGCSELWVDWKEGTKFESLTKWEVWWRT